MDNIYDRHHKLVFHTTLNLWNFAEGLAVFFVKTKLIWLPPLYMLIFHNDSEPQGHPVSPRLCHKLKVCSKTCHKKEDVIANNSEANMANAKGMLLYSAALHFVSGKLRYRMTVHYFFMISNIRLC